jgi:hypothetical protein
MPFDGSSISRDVLVLGGLLEFFEDYDRWVQDTFSDGEGRSCLVDALRITRRRLNIRRDRAAAYLTRAIRQHHREGGLQFFNDHLCSGIEELRDTIRFACALAATYPPDRLPYAPVRPTRYTPSSQPFVHGLAHLERRLSVAAGQLELALD